MTDVIGIRFKNMGKIYYFASNGHAFKKGEHAIVETSRGIECGEVVMENRQLDDSQIPQPLKPVVRVATAEDIRHAAELATREKEALALCAERIAAHKLEMNLIGAECAFDNSKILFYFTAEGRVDFRNLVKDLAGLFHARIELRQVGVRDEAKMLGGLGICGRPLCCAQFLSDFQPVSIKMAKEQGLSLNPTKISGSCGRLMCCLKYEQDVYSSLLKITPKQGALVNTPEGRGTVVEVDLLAGNLKVRLEKSPDSPPMTFTRDDVKTIKDGHTKVEKAELDELAGLE